ELNGPMVDDKTIAWLADHRSTLSGVKTMNLARSLVTDEGIQHLAAFPHLRELDLSNTKITSAGLAVLEQLPELEWLGMTGVSLGFLARTKLKLKYSKLVIAT